MKTLKYILAILILGFSSCNKDRQWEEGDRNTYTWKGQLVKDCHGEPMKNTEIHLWVGYNTVDEAWEEIVANSVTDDNGQFSITYKKVKGTNPNVVLATNDIDLLGAPINQDIERDVTMEDCYMVYLEIENVTGEDSIYVGLGHPKNNPYKFTITMDEIDSTLKIPILGIPLFKSNYRDTLFLKTIAGTRWDNRPIQNKFTYSTNLEEIKKYLISLTSDTIDDYNAYPIELSGYPVVDEVYIEI